MFSERVPRSLAPNRITQAVRRARDGGRPLIDLTVTNPTSVGLDYPASMLQPLASVKALTYSPDPFGLADARRAVAGDYQRRGIAADPARIVLTSSTSEAYSLLFKLLCAPRGDAVMTPIPSYPLFEHLTTLDGVSAVPYRLEYHGRWAIACEEVDRDWTKSIRALLAVSPNNPTGSVLTADEASALATRCSDRHVALIVDEVFADYPIVPAEHLAPPTFPDSLTFRLGGLSKSAGLPQVKLGWILVEGRDAVVQDALERLEIICDAYLSVSTPVQVAAPELITSGAGIRRQIQDRVRANYAELTRSARAHPSVEVLHADAGWSAMLRVPAIHGEEDLVVDLIDRDGVIVHPGFFFDCPHESFLVLSLLPDERAFAEGVRRVMEKVDA
jgi:aspartate/methionine/tyrosine aminotransferase